MNNWGKIAIGTRIGEGRCDPLFFRSWTRLVAGGLQGGDTVLDPAIEMPHHFAANVLAIYFIRSGADTLCMIDSDHVFEPDTLTRMREAGAEYDVLSALTVARRHPYAPTVLKTDGSEYFADLDLIDGSVHDVDLAALGFCLIRRTVFDRLAEFKPWWFDWGDKGLGEDARFSQRALAVGCKLGAHTGVNIQHRATIALEWDNEKRKTTIHEYNQIGELIKREGE